jgi:hypothetical protein
MGLQGHAVPARRVDVHHAHQLIDGAAADREVIRYRDWVEG